MKIALGSYEFDPATHTDASITATRAEWLTVIAAVAVAMASTDGEPLTLRLPLRMGK